MLGQKLRNVRRIGNGVYVYRVYTGFYFIVKTFFGNAFDADYRYLCRLKLTDGKSFDFKLRRF